MDLINYLQMIITSLIKLNLHYNYFQLYELNGLKLFTNKFIKNFFKQLTAYSCNKLR